MKTKSLRVDRSRNSEAERALKAAYSAELKRNSDGSYFARIVELPGCMTEGGSRIEALTNLDDAMRGWIALALKDGNPIPPPMSDAQFSGKFLIRMPHSLHRELARRADMEDVSLNQFVVAALARWVGIDSHPTNVRRDR
jgi:antitoxin HicB